MNRRANRSAFEVLHHVVDHLALLDRYFDDPAIAACGGFDESIERAGDLDLWARIISDKAAKNYAYVATPTTLHFQAGWRTDTNFLPPEMEAWQVLHPEEEVVAAALRFQTSDGFSQQEAVWKTIKTEWTPADAKYDPSPA